MLLKISGHKLSTTGELLLIPVIMIVSDVHVIAANG